MITAYREPDRARGRQAMVKLINSLTSGVPKPLTELITLGRTLKKRTADVLAYFDQPGSSNGPTEAINGRLEHLRGSALGFRNLTNYIARSLLEAGGFRPRLHLDSEAPSNKPTSTNRHKCRCDPFRKWATLGGDYGHQAVPRTERSLP